MRREFALPALVALAVAGCGGGSSSSTGSVTTSRVPRPAPRPRPVRLHPAGSVRLPVARSGSAATSFGRGAVITAGLTTGLVSTTGVFEITASGRVRTLAPLPGAVHDAASAQLGGSVLLFGGGETEGSNRILSVTPGRPRQIGTLPQALSDLVAAPISGLAYVTAGWNGTDTNRDIYAVRPNGSLSTVGRLDLGVRYPAAAALDGRLIVAGGEKASGQPTASAWSFDPSTRQTTRLPNLPAPLDHTAGASLDGTFYALGGLRNGRLTNQILAWRPGLARWRSAGRLPAAVQNLVAARYGGGILALGGRTAAGATAGGTVLKPG